VKVVGDNVFRAPLLVKLANQLLTLLPKDQIRDNQQSKLSEKLDCQNFFAFQSRK
jgi:hypothetical protein